MKYSFAAVYIASRILSIKKNLAGYGKQIRQEQIHRLRVDIKKLRAVFAFIDTMHGQANFPGKILRELFRKAGALRELHITISLHVQFSQSDELLKELREKKRVLSAQFIREIPRYQEMVDAFERSIKLPVYVPKEKELKKYFDAQVQKSEKLLFGSEEKNNVHRFRMRVKKIMYIYDTLPKSSQRNIGLCRKYIDTLQKKAGTWHDTFSAISYFESIKPDASIRLDELREQETKQLASLLEHCKDFKMRMYS